MSSFTSLSRTVALATSIVGGVTIAGLGISAAFDSGGAPSALLFDSDSGIAVLSTGDAPSTANADGATELTVESRASSFDVRFGDVDEAELAVEGEARNTWTLERDGDELVVTNHKRFGDLCLFGCFAGNERVTLTLPSELSGRLDADLTAQAGALEARGDFREANLELGAGSLRFKGGARNLGVDVEAGKADIEATGVRTASFELSAGRADATITGDAPDEVSLDVSAGRLDLALPDAEYRVDQDVSAGSLENDLRTSNSGRHRITVDVSAGVAALHPASD